MPNDFIDRFTDQKPPVLRVSSPGELLSAVPYMLGFHPAQSLVFLGLDGSAGRVDFICRVDLPEAGDDAVAVELAAEITRMARAQSVSTAVLVAYGPAECADGAVALVGTELANLGVDVRDALRVENGRYWPYSCYDPACCPPEGVPYDAAFSTVAAAATFAGLVALPDRATLERSIAPVEGPGREAMRQAHERVREQLDDWSSECGDTTELRDWMIGEGNRRVTAALGRYREGEDPLPDYEVALLGSLLLLYPVRDDAWLRVTPDLRAAHLALWTDVVRRVDDAYVPAPASLLAFAAWQQGDGALASMAVERALRAQPSYPMAALIRGALASGMSPPPWPPAKPLRSEPSSGSGAEGRWSRGGRQR